MKKVISFALVLSMIMSLFCTFAIASSAAEKKALEGEKSAEHIEDDKYGITVKVPGGDGEIQHDEVILMVDGSYSMDNEPYPPSHSKTLYTNTSVHLMRKKYMYVTQKPYYILKTGYWNLTSYWRTT